MIYLLIFLVGTLVLLVSYRCIRIRYNYFLKKYGGFELIRYSYALKFVDDEGNEGRKVNKATSLLIFAMITYGITMIVLVKAFIF